MVDKLQESFETSTASIKQTNIERKYVTEVKNYRIPSAGIVDTCVIVALIVGVSKPEKV